MRSTEIVLDNPVWHALKTKQQRFGSCGRLACCYQPEIAPFSAVVEPSADALLELRTLIPTNTTSLIQSLRALPSTPSIKVEEAGVIYQMVATNPPSPPGSTQIDLLGLSDLAAMIELTSKTRPGPFGKRTPELGTYIGIRRKGRLIAMAGERIHLDGYVEISAVCVDDAYRGQGLAARLINALQLEIFRRAAVPFLHVLQTNQSAVSLYQRLGFEIREKFLLCRLVPASQALLAPPPN